MTRGYSVKVHRASHSNSELKLHVAIVHSTNTVQLIINKYNLINELAPLFHRHLRRTSSSIKTAVSSPILHVWVSRSFTYLCQNAKQWLPLCLKKSLTSRRMQLQWIHAALTSDSECLLVGWRPEMDLTGSLIAPAGNQQTFQISKRNVFCFLVIKWFMWVYPKQQTAHVMFSNLTENGGSFSCNITEMWLLQKWDYSGYVIVKVRRDISAKGSLDMFCVRLFSIFQILWGYWQWLKDTG